MSCGRGRRRGGAGDQAQPAWRGGSNRSNIRAAAFLPPVFRSWLTARRRGKSAISPSRLPKATSWPAREALRNSPWAGGSQPSHYQLDAGSKNSDGSVAYVGNVDASGSGVVGGQVNITATGNISGLVIASVGANVSALQNVNATVLSQGSATVSAGGTVSGTIVGAGLVTVSGASDVAAAFSVSSVSANGVLAGAAVPAAPTGSSSAAAASATQPVRNPTQDNSNWRPMMTPAMTIPASRRRENHN